MSDEYRMKMAFESDAPEFALGFEAGGIYAAAIGLSPAFAATIHASNKKQMERIAEASGRAVAFSFLNDDWLQAHFSERYVPPPG